MILITGGLGFIGSNLALQFLANGKQVVLVDNLSNGHLQVLERIEFVSGQSVPFIKLDVRNTPILHKVFEQFPIRSVVHCAGFKSIDESLLKPLEYYNDNVSCIMSLMRAMQRTGVRQLVHLSSLQVYALSSATLDEQSPFNRHYANPYIQSQQMIEQIIADTHQTDHEWNIAILRIANVMGAFEHAVLGEMIPQTPKSILALALQVVAGQRSHIELQQHSDTADGTAERTFVHVQDVANAIERSMEWLLQQNHSCEAFNIATAQPHSIQTLLDMVSSITKAPIETQSSINAAPELAVVGSSSDKAQSQLMWQPKWQLEDMIMHQWQFYQNLLSGR